MNELEQFKKDNEAAWRFFMAAVKREFWNGGVYQYCIYPSSRDDYSVLIEVEHSDWIPSEAIKSSAKLIEAGNAMFSIPYKRGELYRYFSVDVIGGTEIELRMTTSNID